MRRSWCSSHSRSSGIRTWGIIRRIGRCTAQIGGCACSQEYSRPYISRTSTFYGTRSLFSLSHSHYPKIKDQALVVLLTFLNPPNTPSFKYSQIQNSIAELLSSSLRITAHRSSVASWKPLTDRVPPGRPQRKLSTRRWEKPSDLSSLGEDTGWVAKRLVKMASRANVTVSLSELR